MDIAKAVILIILICIGISVYNSPESIQRREWNAKFYGCAQNHMYRKDCDIILRSATYVKPKRCNQYGCY